MPDVELRAFAPDDEAALVSGRDDESRRWLGPGVDHPRPTAVIVVGGEIVGWVDSDPEADGLAPGETNVGYNVFPPHRGRGYAPEAVRQLVQWLRRDGGLTTAVLSIAPGNAASLRVAEKAGFTPTGERSGSLRFVAPLTVGPVTDERTIDG